MKIVAITGGSGSGKSHFVRLLQNALGEKASVLSLDNYYKPRHTQLKDENGIENFDLPSAFDSKKLFNDLHKLKAGESIVFKQYNYNNQNLILPDIEVKPTPILLLEGIFVLNYEPVLPLIDYKVFIEANPALSLERRLKRDLQERGYDASDVNYRFTNHAYPAYEAYILPCKSQADFVIVSDENINDKVEVFLKSLV